MASPVTSLTTVATGPSPPSSRGPGTNVKPPSGRRHVEQDRDVVGALVGDDQVGPAVEVGDGDADRVGAGGEALAAVQRRAELAVAETRIDQHVVAAAVGHDQVGDAVAVQVGQDHGAGGEQAAGAVGHHVRLSAGVIDDDLVEPLVGVDEVGRGAPVGQDRQGHVLVGIAIGPEGAVAVAQEHEDIAVGVADEQVELAVAVDVGEVRPVGSGPALMVNGSGRKPPLPSPR